MKCNACGGRKRRCCVWRLPCGEIEAQAGPFLIRAAALHCSRYVSTLQ